MISGNLSARESGPARAAMITALLGIALLLTATGCGTGATSFDLAEAHVEWIAFADELPAGETAADREDRAEKLAAEATRLLGDRQLTGLAGDEAYHAGSLLLAAGRAGEAAAMLESALPGLGSHKDQALVAAAAARLETGDADRARDHLMAVSDRTIAPAVAGSWCSVTFDLAEAFEEEQRWFETLPLLQLVRDSGDDRLGPVAARWIAYVHRDAGNEQAAKSAARDAMDRYPEDENLNVRMTNFLHQGGLVERQLPELPRMTWVGEGADGMNLAELMEGKVVLIDIWAPWCPPCRRSFSFLRELQQVNGDLGFQVVGLTRLYGYYEVEEVRVPDTPPERELELIEAFVASHDLTWPVGVTDHGDKLFTALGVAGIPNFIVIDRKGVVRGTFLGETAPTRARIEAMINDSLNISLDG